MHRIPGFAAASRRSLPLAICVLLLPLAGATAADEEVRCPDCNIEGKMACPDCRGRGEKVEDCRRCQGTGRRPCPRCMQEGSGRLEGGWTALKPGTLNCDMCRGKRFTRREDEPCRRCLGAGAIQCTQCGGRGSLPCRKQVTMGICPTCKFVGKVSCMTCNGSTLIPPSLLKTRRTLPTPAELDGRFRDLTSRYKEHFSDLVEDPQECLNALRKEVNRRVLMMRSRAPGRCTGLLAALEGLLLTVSRVQQRAGKLRDLFRRFEVS
jgi:hypothetical protein